ncbi:MAG: 2-oxoacid:acceptor oxidoreductase family protein [Nitrospiraceae bacterium]|nr:2-oxoacid:acceptor oxidoreductase family protein [Nitrospiraceae bacterium]
MLFLGKVFSFAGMLEEKEVTWFPSYGAEMRGGTANCTVIISDTMIGSPVVLNPDILVSMNKASLDKFQPRVKKHGLVFYDLSLIKDPALRDDVLAVAVPATEIASSAGNTKSANMVMLGAVLAGTGLLKRSSVLKVIEGPTKSAGGNGIRANTNSLLKGIQYIEDTKGKNR